MKKLTTEEFIERAVSVHGDNYCYDEVVYINSHTKVNIICPNHGVFEQKPNGHLSGKGCPKCVGLYKDRYASNNIPRYYHYQPQLEPYGVECRWSPSDENVLEVKCIYCDRWYTPTQLSIKRKIDCIKGHRGGEHNLYCSHGCKISCPTYWKQTYPEGYKTDTSREVQPYLRKMVLKRDEWTCQHCESTKDRLHCHHITGVEINPIESADVDNCITLCYSCHNKLHKRDDCDMRRKECK